MLQRSGMVSSFVFALAWAACGGGGVGPSTGGGKAGSISTGGAASGGAATGGARPSGGTVANGGALGGRTGGIASSGGTAMTGGSPGTGGSGVAGGSPISGGSTVAGGTAAKGGSTTGGTSTPGGITSTGGAPTSGGIPSPGGSSGPYRFSNVAIGGGGFVSAVIASTAEKNLFYARTDVGGLYRWDESNQSWIPLLDWIAEDQVGFLGVESVALDPQAPGRVYALVGISYFNNGKTAILRSTDYGNTFSITDVTSQFKAHGNGMGRQTGERLAVDPNLGSTLFCGTRRDGLWKSTDQGVTWNKVTGFPVTTTPNDNGVSFVVFDPSSGTSGKATQRLFAGVSRSGAANLYVSTDGGTSWTAMPGAPPTTHMPGRAALAANGMLYVTYGNGAGPHGHWAVPEPMDSGSLWKGDLAAGTWKNITPAGVTRAFSGITVNASNPNHLVTTTVNTYQSQPWGWGDRIFVSSDGGGTWTDLIGQSKVTMDTNGIPWIINHAIHWAGTIVMDPFNPDRAFVTSGNGIFSTSNLSAEKSTWKFTVKGLEETVPLEAISIPEGNFVSAIGDYDGFIHADPTVYPPNGKHKPAIGSTHGLAYAGMAKTHLVRVGADKNKIAVILRSTDSGNTWAEVTKPSSGQFGSVALTADGSTLVWTPQDSAQSHRIQTIGGAWTPITGLNFNTQIAADLVNAKKLYAYSKDSGALFASMDSGATFAQASVPGKGGSKKIRVVPGVEGDVWIPLYSAGLVRSTDSGAAFTKIANVSVCGAIGFGKATTGKTFPTVFIWGKANGGPSGIYRSTDEGATWERVNDDQHQFGGPGNGQFIVGDMNVFGRVYMSTAGRGIVYGEPK